MRHLVKLTVTFMALLLLTGCWSRKELNELSIASALGIDKHGDKYTLSVQIVNPSVITTVTGNNGIALPVVTRDITSTETLFAALREVTRIASRKVYASHIQMLVIGEELAREGIAPALDFLSRDHAMRTDFFIIVAKQTTAENILKILTPLDNIPSDHLHSSLIAAEKNWGGTTQINLHDLIYDLLSPGADPVLAALRIKGDTRAGALKSNTARITPAALLSYEGLGAFDNDRLVSWYTPQETKAYNFLKGKIKSVPVSMSCPGGGKATIEIFRSGRKMKGSIVDGQPQASVHIKAEANVADLECERPLSNLAAMKDMEQAAAQNIEAFIKAAIHKSQQLKTDSFGFGDMIYRSRPKQWKKISKEWKSVYFPKLKVDVVANIKIGGTGSVTDSFLPKMKEK